MTQRWPDLSVLELLVAVSDYGSIRAAAQALGMAQPNASRALAELERSMGLALLERHPRGSSLSANGLLLVEWAAKVLRSAHELKSGVEALHRQLPPELRVAASMTVAEYCMPLWLAELRRRAPDVQVNLQVLNSMQVINQVRAGDLHLGFIETPRKPTGLHYCTVSTDNLTVVTAPGHPWTKITRPLGLTELARTPLIQREPGSGTREAVNALLNGMETAPPAQILTSNAAVRVAVAAGTAPGILSELAVRSAVQSGDLCAIPVAGQVCSRPLAAIWTGPRRLSGAAALLVTTAAVA